MKYTAMDVKKVKRSINLIYNHLDPVNMYKLGDDLHNVLMFLDMKEAEDDERRMCAQAFINSSIER